MANRARLWWTTAAVVVLLAGGMAGTGARAGQPKMAAALASLRDARAALREATADKGGHRQKALELIEQAIIQVQAGIDYGRER
jgi:hypothetical protein